VDAVVLQTAPPLTPGSLSGRLGSGRSAPTAPRQALLGSAGGPRRLGARSASAVGAVRDCPARRLGTGCAPGVRNLPDPRCPRDFPVPPLRAVDAPMNAEATVLGPGSALPQIRSGKLPPGRGEPAPRFRRRPPDERAPRNKLAGISAGRAAPTPADGGRPWAATPSRRSLRSGSPRALRPATPQLHPGYAIAPAGVEARGARHTGPREEE
jgi:hypothetical protein